MTKFLTNVYPFQCLELSLGFEKPVLQFYTHYTTPYSYTEGSNGQCNCFPLEDCTEVLGLVGHNGRMAHLANVTMWGIVLYMIMELCHR